MALHIQEIVDIDASCDAVWAQLARVDGWTAWNHVHTELDGPLAPGTRMRLAIPLPRGRTWRATARLTRVEPGHALVWAGGPRGLLHAVHGFTLQPLGPSRCRLVHHETFHGVLTGLLPALLGPDVGARHRGLNERLKAVVEDNAA